MAGRCPWCDSVSLRAFPDRGAVLCVNPACRCPEPDCGCHDDPAYRHTWDEGNGTDDDVHQGRDADADPRAARRTGGRGRPATIRKWVQLGHLTPAAKAGRAQLFRLEDVFAAERAAGGIRRTR